MRRHLNRSKECLPMHLAADFDPPGVTDKDVKRPAPTNPCTRLVGPTPFWATLLPPMPARDACGSARDVQQESFGARLSTVQTAVDAQQLLQWWHRFVLQHTVAEISRSVPLVVILVVVAIAATKVIQW